MTGETTPMAHLAASDKVMAGLIAEIGQMSVERRRRGRPKGDSYGTLLRAIVGQQLSVKAAATIFDRVLALFGGKVPTPQQLLDADEAELRGAGLSGRKVEYMKDLALKVESGDLELDRFDELTDEEIVAELTAVRGLGVWTAHMFLIFHLERPDVLPVGDLGVRNAVATAYGLDEPPSPGEMERIAEPWRPHRTLASLYLWESYSSTPG
ncbi:MAG: DNA-3-methyladenine glycosylase [Actinomycetota bacterium]|nr:DNA-3-methyladenine glycosylase [Actinomycetota bacterium]